MTALPKLDFTLSTVPQVHEWLRAEIISGRLGPGERLSEVEIARRFGISRQPAREAFILLTAEGLAEVRPQRGTFIRAISLSSVLSARLIREAVESDLVRMLAERADPPIIARLDAEIAAQVAAKDRDDVEGFVLLDDRFHRMLASAAGQDAVWNVLESLKSQMNRLRNITARASDLQKLIDQHMAIVDALRVGDADAAEAGMRLHLRELLSDLTDIAGKRPDIFTD